ncbi:pseudouridine synthase [Cunninghamella echinulata]|nr:pseudouridine synthase [Cunninghamella echinulata]
MSDDNNLLNSTKISMEDNNNKDIMNENLQQQHNNINESTENNSNKKRKRQVVDQGHTYPPKQRKQQRKIDFRDTNDISDANYYFENGLRKVKPYYFNYQAYAKGRWLGKTILDVFTTEFRDRSEVYYRYAIEKGLLTINGENVTTETIIKNGDIIGHKIHRHEPPVIDSPIKIVYEADNLLVVDKPGSIPVHPAGRYRHNSVVHILRNEKNIPKLYPSNRLDRLTSGLMLICKTSLKAAHMEHDMKNGNIQKEYVCRVDGEFPTEEIVCDQPIKIISHKLSMNYVHPDGKPCTTIFNRLSFDGTTSIVRCRPITGRTHQIRVHLKYLGFPIGNDPLYGNKTSWAKTLHIGQPLSEQDEKQLVDKLMEASPYQTGVWDDDDNDKKKDESKLLEKETGEKCLDCSVALLQDPPRDSLFIWLHAWKYKGNDWEFETDLPDWAKEN